MPQEITIQYAITRKELWRWYWWMWLRQLIVIHLYVAWQLYSEIDGLYKKGIAHGIEPILIGCGIMLCYLALMIAFPQIMYKSQMRTLTVSDKGIYTTIGKKKGDIAWDKVSRIDNEVGYIAIVRKNLNSFIIPDRAFETQEKRSEFLSAVDTWLAKVKA
jgi:hypothetical protein